MPARTCPNSSFESCFLPSIYLWSMMFSFILTIRFHRHQNYTHIHITHLDVCRVSCLRENRIIKLSLNCFTAISVFFHLHIIASVFNVLFLVNHRFWSKYYVFRSFVVSSPDKIYIPQRREGNNIFSENK